MKTKLYALLLSALTTFCSGAPNSHEDEKTNAIDLWQKAQKIPEGQNPKADLARQVIKGLLKVEQVTQEGIIASGTYSVPGYFKPQKAFVFNEVFRFQADILVVGYKASVTDGAPFGPVLYPCGVYKKGSRTLKRYATTFEQAWALLHPSDDINGEIESLEIEKKRIEARLIELRKQQVDK